MGNIRKTKEEKIDDVQNISELPENIPEAPAIRESTDVDAFNIKTIAMDLNRAYSQDRTDEFVKKTSEEVPALVDILSTNSLKEQISIVTSKVPPTQYHRLLMDLVTIGYHYHERDKEINKALGLAELRYSIADMLPKESDSGLGIWLSRSRYMADALDEIGSIYVRLDEPSRALYYYHRAEKLYESDLLEHESHGIRSLSEFDSLFIEQDPRIYLFQKIVALYRQLGDQEKVQEYTKRIQSIPLRTTDKSVIFSELSRGDDFVTRKQFDEALSAYNNALELSISDPSSRLVISRVTQSLEGIAKVLMNLRLYYQAHRYYKRALELNLGRGNQEAITHDLMEIGKICGERPQLGNSLDYYEKALQCSSVPSVENDKLNWKSSGGDTLKIINPELAWNCTLCIARWYVNQNISDLAIKFYELAITMAELSRTNVIQNEYRITFQSNRLDPYSEMVLLEARLSLENGIGDLALNQHAVHSWETSERARSRAFLDLLGTSVIGAPAEIPDSMRNNEISLVRTLHNLARLNNNYTGGQDSTNWEKYYSTYKELEKLWKEMSLLSAEAHNYVELRQGQPVNFNEIIELLN